MTITVEERLRRAAELLDEVSVQPRADVVALAPRRPRRAVALVAVRAAAVVLILGAAVGVAWLAIRGPSASAPASSPTDIPASMTTVAAGTTQTTMAFESLPDLPDLSPTPVTVAGTAPTLWYRLVPELDVSWYRSGSDDSQLCFRTAAAVQCQADRFTTGGYIAVRNADDQWLIVTIDALDEVAVTLEDGSQQLVPVTPPDDIVYRVGRMVGPRPVDALMIFDEAGSVAATTTTTASLTSTPDTVATTSTLTPNATAASNTTAAATTAPPARP